LVAQPDSDPGCLPWSFSPCALNTAVELSPQSKRVRIADPPEPQVELQQWSEPEFRNEVRTLKAQVRALLNQEVETRNKHNLLLEESYNEFKTIHEQKVQVEAQFAMVAQQLHTVDAKCDELHVGAQSLKSDMGLAKQGFDHLTNDRNAKLTNS